ncbi:MAG: hypothetical protein KIT36_19240 [Alphaproteobacteria bacterium]|nr:hypothetical protein [Alphaproteobacteria bacterium]
METAVHPLPGLFLISLCLWLGGCAVPAEVAVASYAADGGLLLATDKTSNDHLLSMAAGRDCALWRAVRGRAICKNYKPGEENPYDVNYDAPYREVGEGGMVTVYTASRQGGALLTGDAAASALRSQASGVAPPPGDLPPVPTGDPHPQTAGGRTVQLADVLPAPDSVIPAATPPREAAPSRTSKRGGGKTRRKGSASAGSATRHAVPGQMEASRAVAGKPTPSLSATRPPVLIPLEGIPTMPPVEAAR